MCFCPTPLHYNEKKKNKLARFTVHTVLIMWQSAQTGSLPGLKCNSWDTHETGKGSGKTGITKHCVTNRSAMFHLLEQVKRAVHSGQTQGNRGADTCCTTQITYHLCSGTVTYVFILIGTTFVCDHVVYGLGWAGGGLPEWDSMCILSRKLSRNCFPQNSQPKVFTPLCNFLWMHIERSNRCSYTQYLHTLTITIWEGNSWTFSWPWRQI